MSEKSWQQRVLALMRSPKFRPVTKSGLARALDVPPDDRAAFRGILDSLEAKGLIHCGKKGLYGLRSHTAGGLSGKIQLLPKGGGLFFPDRHDRENRGPLLALGLNPGQENRIFIPDHEVATALSGDNVTVKAAPNRFEPASIEGRVLRVLERSGRKCVGTLVKRGHDLLVKPDDPALPDTVDVGGRDERTEVIPGHKVLFVIESWEHRARRPKGRILKDLGAADTPGLGMVAILYKYNLPAQFPVAVLREAESIDPAIPAEELARREDWRERDVITIDPDDARDFDDAICVTPLKGGGWELAVHIADVAHYVKPGSPLDRETEERGNSVYLADRVIPMLPEKLSNGLCSLQPDVERLTFLAVMTFDSRGKRTAARFARAVIRSRRRFTYEEAFQEMKAAHPKDRDPALDRAWPLASLLRRRRFEAGSLDLDFPELKVYCDAQGRPERLARVEHDESHQMIEEFMLAANEAVAQTIRESGIPGIYRIHEDPDEEKLAEFRFYLASCGLAAGDLTQKKEIQRVLRDLQGRADAGAIKLAFLKSLKRAAYHEDPKGHYGLAKRDYTHFTSPIRRYADLVVHRTLAAWLAKTGQSKHDAARSPSYTQMGEIALHLSETERTAADAEQESKKLMQCEYFAALLRKRPVPTFSAGVVEVRKYGVFIELTDVPIRGFVKTSDFPYGDWMWDPMGGRHYSRRPRYSLQPGTVVTVAPCSVDIGKRQIDFRMVEKETPPPKKVSDDPRRRRRGHG